VSKISSKSVHIFFELSFWKTVKHSAHVPYLLVETASPVTATAERPTGQRGHCGRWCSSASPTACWSTSRHPCSPTECPPISMDWSGRTARRSCYTMLRHVLQLGLRTA